MNPTTTTEIPGTSALAELTCVITLCTTVTQDRPGRDVAILEEASDVILSASPRGLAWRLPGGLRHHERTVLADELGAFVTQHPRGAFVLERMLVDDNGRAVHIEAHVLPVEDDERADLAELLADEHDPDGGRELAQQYAADLERAAAARQPAGRIPVCFLEDLGPSEVTPVALAA